MRQLIIKNASLNTNNVFDGLSEKSMKYYKRQTPRMRNSKRHSIDKTKCVNTKKQFHFNSSLL